MASLAIMLVVALPRAMIDSLAALQEEVGLDEDEEIAEFGRDLEIDLDKLRGSRSGVVFVVLLIPGVPLFPPNDHGDTQPV
ncbi:hypothetical protein EJ03DRAFT_355610 [Teratosphaeria nubilosa]|uniref:Uncharacterized protein n=1 Tax=Teratosphaeria nubilosa TaxID=161662 RepID=A0A6G1KX24_9PEZI|nr:hypothetical protein EJ03DRAFT_355610 [Teratosphaeria nubilosa]